MYPVLFEYLLLYKRLPVPGIGTFLLERAPARIDFPNKLMYPPVYSITLIENNGMPAGNFFQWLGRMLRISDREAVIRFNDFAFEMKKQIGEGDVINWNGVGTVKKGLAGEIRFIPGAVVITEDPVPAARVLREKAEHMVRVGEEEKTAAEMQEILAHQEQTKSWWWVWALAAGLLMVVFTGWYLSEHGVLTGSVANTQKLVPLEATPTYRTIP